jgi:hypothetical protein
MIDDARFDAIKDRFRDMGLLEIPDVAFLVIEVEVAIAAEKRRQNADLKRYHANRDAINAKRRAKSKKNQKGGAASVHLAE